MKMMLTKAKPDGSWSVVGADGQEIPAREIPTALYGAMCKLHDYEKTGLNPEAIEKMKDENSWLVSASEKLAAENACLRALVDDIKKVVEGEN